MKAFLKRFFEILTPGTACVLAAIGIGFVLSRFGAAPFLWIVPSDVLKGQLWRLVTHAFVPVGIVDLLMNGLFLFMVGTWLEKVWSRWDLVLFALLSALAAGAVKIALGFWDDQRLFGTMPLVFGFLTAWARLFGHEKVLMMGVWEMTIWQAALLIGGIDVIILATCPCFGWANLLAVSGTSAILWLYLSLRWKRNLACPSRAQANQRIGRLEF
jgi:membrane associated rhomboid family serine protease